MGLTLYQFIDEFDREMDPVLRKHSKEYMQPLKRLRRNAKDKALEYYKNAIKEKLTISGYVVLNVEIKEDFIAIITDNHGTITKTYNEIAELANITRRGAAYCASKVAEGLGG